ncbi:DUF4845 domain-containing protein [Endozoicomonas montiporae]|nr:DUF4845 domain-containing protein [Endozoicomonas montiporae]
MKSRQKGLSLFSTLIAIMVGGVVFTAVVKLGPLYMDDYAIARVLKSLDDKPGIASAGVPEVKEWLNKGLKTNLVELDPKEIRVKQDRYDGVMVDIDYERRIKFIRNVDLIVSFEHDWKVKPQ